MSEDIKSVKSPEELSFDSSTAPELTAAQKAQQIKMMRKRQENEFNDYKKNLLKNVELKRLQVEELELSIKHYNNKMEFKALQPKIKQLELEEAAAFEQAKAEAIARAKAEAGEPTEETPKIVIPKVGKPRSETEKTGGKEG